MSDPAIKPEFVDRLPFCSGDCPSVKLCIERDSFYKYECPIAQIRMGVSELCQPWNLQLQDAARAFLTQNTVSNRRRLRELLDEAGT